MHNSDYNEWMNEHAKARNELKKAKQRAEISKNYKRTERRETLFRWIATAGLFGVVAWFGYVMWVTA